MDINPSPSDSSACYRPWWTVSYFYWVFVSGVAAWCDSWKSVEWHIKNTLLEVQNGGMVHSCWSDCLGHSRRHTVRACSLMTLNWIKHQIVVTFASWTYQDTRHGIPSISIPWDPRKGLFVSDAKATNTSQSCDSCCKFVFRWRGSHSWECWSTLLLEDWLRWTLTSSQTPDGASALVTCFQFVLLLFQSVHLLWGILWDRQRALSWWYKSKGQVETIDLMQSLLKNWLHYSNCTGNHSVHQSVGRPQ